MQEGELPQEIARQEARWTAEDLRSYLLAQAHNLPGRDYCMEQAKFPRQIALDPIWQETFERMRAETATNHREYWAMVGVTNQRDKLVILEKFVVGQRFLVSPEAIDSLVSKVRRTGISHLVGDIHSHPAWAVEKWLRNQDVFSIADLYGLLISRRSPAVRFLVGPHQNMAAFRSQESELVPAHLSQRAFERYWDRRHYVRLRVGDAFSMNIAVGKRHGLTFYKGFPGQPIVRVFP